MKLSLPRARGGVRSCALASLALLAFASTSAAQVDPVYRLMRRITPGFTLADYNTAVAMGFDAYLAQQLQYQGLTDVENIITNDPNFDVVKDSPEQIELNYGASMVMRGQARLQLRLARLYRALFSQQKLYERMGEFWFDHLNIDQDKGKQFALLPLFEEKVTRLHALGQFRDMIHASAGDSADRCTAMLEYLDNTQSKCGGGDIPNENYARELMELHVLGTDPQVYDEPMVLDLSAILSGWRKINQIGGDQWGLFTFTPSWHCAATYPNFCNVNIPADPMFPTEGQLAIDALVDHVDPVHGHIASRFIARKMASMLLTDSVPQSGQAAIDYQAAVDAAVLAFGPHGDISAMVDALLDSTTINTIVDAHPKLMAPRLYVTSLFIASQATLTSIAHIRTLDAELVTLGQQSHNWGPPNGYPDSAAAFKDDQSGRWNFAYRLFTGGIIGVDVNVDNLYAPFGGFDRTTAGEDVNQILTGGNLSTDEVEILQRYADLSSEPDSEMKKLILALGAMTLGFNLY